MKKIGAVMFITTVVILLLTNTLFAGNVEKGDDGSLRLNEVVITYSPVDITVSKEALSHEMEWKEAIKTPGVVVPLVTTRESQMVDFLHRKITTVVTGIVFDKRKKVVEIVKGREVGEEVVFNPYFILWGLSILAMVSSNISFKKRRDNNFAAFATIIPTAFAAAFATTIPTTFAVVVATFATTFAAVVAGAVVGVVVAESGKKAYVILVITYYALMGVGALIVVASM